MTRGESNITATIAADAAGQRLDRALAAALPTLSRERLKALISSGRVTGPAGLVRDPATKALAGAVTVRVVASVTVNERLTNRWFMFVECVTVESRIKVILAISALFDVDARKVWLYVALPTVLSVGRTASPPVTLNRYGGE